MFREVFTTYVPVAYRDTAAAFGFATPEILKDIDFLQGMMMVVAVIDLSRRRNNFPSKLPQLGLDV
jgi:hypothetical protein